MPKPAKPTPPTPPTAHQLERLLAAAAFDAAERPAFLAAVLTSEVIALGAFERRALWQAIRRRRGPKVELLTLADPEGPIIPFFSSPEMLDATRRAVKGLDAPSFTIHCRELFGHARGQRLVLNPDGPHAKIFLPGEVDALLAGKDPGMTVERLQREQTVLVGAPASTPEELLAVLARFLVQRPTAQAAHLGWIVHPDGGAGFLMVVVGRDPKQIMDGLGTVATDEITGGPPLEVIVVPPGTDDHVLANLAPFYVRPGQADVPVERPSQ